MHSFAHSATVYAAIKLRYNREFSLTSRRENFSPSRFISCNNCDDDDNNEWRTLISTLIPSSNPKQNRKARN